MLLKGLTSDCSIVLVVTHHLFMSDSFSLETTFQRLNIIQINING